MASPSYSCAVGRGGALVATLSLRNAWNVEARVERARFPRFSRLELRQAVAAAFGGERGSRVEAHGVPLLAAERLGDLARELDGEAHRREAEAAQEPVDVLADPSVAGLEVGVGAIQVALLVHEHLGALGRV